MKLFTTILLILSGFGMLSQSMCECNPNMDVYRYTYEENYEVITDSVYTKTNDLLAMIADWGTSSPFMMDFDNNGIVDTIDLLALLGGFGNTYEGSFDYCNVVIDFVNSHGWPSSYPEAWFVIIHTSQIDEDTTDGTGYSMCPLVTVWIELVYSNHPTIPDHVEKYFMR